MYICEECGCVFDDPLRVNTTYESFYGVSDSFDSSTPMELNLCPNCRSEEYKEVEEDEQ